MRLERRMPSTLLAAFLLVAGSASAANALALPALPLPLPLAQPPGAAAPAGRWWTTVSGGSPGQGNGYGTAVGPNDAVADVGWVGTNDNSTDPSAFIEQRADDTGDIRWSHSAARATANAVAVGPLGSVVVGGAFYAPTSFGGPVLTAQTSTAYLVSYEGSTGTFLWQRSLPGVFSIGAGTVATDPLGDVIVVGSFGRPVDFGLGMPIAPAGPEDIFVAKYSGLTGAALWVRTFASSDGAAATGVAITATGDAIVVGQFGYFGGSLTLGVGSPLPPPAEDGRFAGFVARLEGRTGQPVWSHGFAGGGTTGIFDPQVSVDPAGDVLVAGQKGAGEDFGGGPTPNDLPFNAGFVAKYSGVDGGYRWAWSAFGFGAYDAITTVKSDALGNPVLGGHVSYLAMKSAAGDEFVGPTPGHVTVARLSGATGRPQATFLTEGADVNGLAVDQAGHVFTTGLAYGAFVAG
jgi:hypothetical protein